MALALLALFVIWPLIGSALLHLANRRALRRRGAARFPPAHSFGEVLLRMYLWPLLLLLRPGGGAGP